MKQIFLIHWHSTEAAQLAAPLQAEGWAVAVEVEDGARAATRIRDKPPDAVVIFHTRLPSHGRATAAHLAEQKATRAVPIIFVGGQGEALEKTRAKLPHAAYIAPEALIHTLKTLKDEK